MTVACMMGGEVITPGPTDICLIPPLEISAPFTNYATWTQSAGFADNVLINCSPSCNVNTFIYTSVGDEAGSSGGIISGVIEGPAFPSTGLNNVLINGMPACNFGTTQTQSNLDNTVGVYSVPSQFNVIAA